MHPAEAERQERFKQSFDIEPEKGVPLDPLAQVQETVEEEADSPDTEAQAMEQPEESQIDETPEATDGDDEVVSLGDMGIGQFSNAAGVELSEVYKLKMPDGRTLSQAVDETRSQRAELERLRQDNQQLQESAQRATQQAINQPVSPDAQRLALQADFLEQQYGQIKWDQIEASERADLKIEYDRQIQGLRREAQGKQAEYERDLDAKRHQFQQEAHRETLRLIPEWNSREVFDSDTSAMTNMLRSVYGMPDQQIAMLPGDPVSMKIIRDLWEMTKKTTEASKGVKKIRKVSKSFSPSAKRPGKSNKLAEVGERLKKAGGDRATRQRNRLTAQFER